MVKKIDETIFEFSTPQEPKVERYTIQQMNTFVQTCDNEIRHLEVEKVAWKTMISEAEALDA